MEFSIVEKSGVPEELLNEFYEEGKNKGNFGTTEYRANSEQYDTLALVADNKVVGTADTLYPDQEASMAGCYILPEYRGRLEMHGKSAFEHLAKARIEETDRPLRTLATTNHGATQHVYSKFDFTPYEFELPSDEWQAPHVKIAQPHEKRRFDRQIFAPDSISDFVNHVASSFDQRTEMVEGDYTGVEVNYMPNVFDDDYEFFKVREGNQPLSDAIGDIMDKKQDAVNATVRVDPEHPSSYEFIDELLNEGFRPLGYAPVIEDSELSQTSNLHFGYSNEPMRSELIPETQSFMEVAGWELEPLEEKDNSTEFRVL